MYDDIKALDDKYIFYVYNNEYESFPSLIGRNVVDIVNNAIDMGMEYFCARYVDSSGTCYCHKYRIVKNKGSIPPSLILIK